MIIHRIRFPETSVSVLCLLCMTITLVVIVHCGNSSERQILASGKGVTAMLGLKETIEKIASLRTETTYKARYLDESAKTAISS